MSQVVIQAVEFVHDGDSVVGSAERCAVHVVSALRGTDPVVVSFRGMPPGVPSSYYNVLLKAAVDAVGSDHVRIRMAFDLDSAAQRFVFLRSWAAVVGPIAPRLAS
jgi:hypothetical protein